MSFEVTQMQWVGLGCALLAICITWVLARTPQAELRLFFFPEWKSFFVDGSRCAGLLFVTLIFIVGYATVVHLFAEFFGLPYNKAIGILLAVLKTAGTYRLLWWRKAKRSPALPA